MNLRDLGNRPREDLEGVDADYVRRVDELARLCDGTPFFNASLGHAAVIVERMMADACKSVSILSGSLEPRVYGESRVLRKSMRFLSNPHCKMRIILEGNYPDVLRDNAFLERFEHHERVSLKFMPERIQSRYKFHFLVADGESYRIEADKSKSSAIVAFGHKEGALNLERVFGNLWKLAEDPHSKHVEKN